MSGTRQLKIEILGNSTNAQKAFTDVGAKADATSSRGQAAFSKLFGQLNASGVLGPFGEAIDKIQGQMGVLSEKNKSVGKTMMGIGAAGLGAGGILTAIGSREQAATQQLKAAIDATGGSYEDFGAKIEKVVKTDEKFGHTSVDTSDAIRILTQATGDTNVALGDMAVVANLAAAKHESLSAAATSLARVHGGATKVLKEFGLTAVKAGDNTKAMTAATKLAETADIAETKAKLNLATIHVQLAGKTHLTSVEQLKLTGAEQALTLASAKATAAHKALADMHSTVTTKAQAANDNITALGQKLAGQASAQADTFTGHMKAITTQVEDQAAKLGQKYGPALTAAGAGMSLLGGLTEAGAGALSKFKGAQEAATAATEAQTGAEDAAAVSEGLALGPILLIIAAIAILAVGIYELVTHWKTVWQAIQDAVGAAIGFVKSVISSVIDWIGGHWQLILAILTGPFGLVVLFVKDHFGQIMTFLKGLPGQISGIASGMWDGISSAFRSVVNSIIDLWNGLHFSIPSIDTHIPGIGKLGGVDVRVPQIPHMAAGGTVAARPGGTLALLGEGGFDERVTPLDGRHGNGGGSSFHIENFHAGNQEPYQISRELAWLAKTAI